MALCLGHYYGSRDPLGAAGDFTTAPEISQVFGEIIGAWLIDQWQRLGSPSPCRLIELGPGRGTLMADIWRISALAPAFRSAIEIVLVETSPVLRERQATALPVLATWTDRVEDVPDGPTLIVANEFFDALPVRQLVCTGGVWGERTVALDPAGTLVFAERALPLPPHPAPSGDGIFETCPAAIEVATAIAERLSRHPGAALIIDYGHGKSAFGDTIQAVRAHWFAGVLDQPGEADLTTHVDFDTLGRALRAGGAEFWGPVGQGEFLLENGAQLRADRLAGRQATEADSAAIRHAVQRLIDRAGMGTLFKVCAATSPGTARPPGFPDA